MILSCFVECVLQGVQSEDGSVYYYLPTGYNPYGSGTLVGVDGQCVGQQPYYSSAGYLQPPVSYGSDPARCYSWDSAYVGDTFNGTSGGFANGKYGGSAQGKLNGFNTDKTNGSTDSKFSKTSYSQANKPLSKVYSIETFLRYGIILIFLLDMSCSVGLF